MSERKELWRKHNVVFAIEIKVGNAWVEHEKRQVEEDAIAEAKRILNDSSVSAVRVYEHNLKHVCTSVFEDKADVVLRVPSKMESTGRKQSCPGCYDLAPVASDGDTEWVFCAACDRAFPV